MNAGYEPTILMPRRGAGDALPPGHRLQEFVVEGLIGVGGYGIVYRVRDLGLDRVAALKEYFPAALAMRDEHGIVGPRSPRQRALMELGLRSFVNEARLLASFDHPAIVKVHRFWTDSGTAYMLMPLYEGLTLRKWLSALGVPPSEAWLRRLATQLAEALEVLHRQRCFHRDVAPDNVLLLYDPRRGPFLEQETQPLLLDFGAARRVIGEATHALTAILKSGYSPVEQYAGDGAMAQGAWTDVYALCAMLYAAVTGQAPPTSISRLMNDGMVPASVAAAGRYSVPFLAAIDAGLAVRPEARPQTMAVLRAMMDGAPLPEAPAAARVALPPLPSPAALPEAGRVEPPLQAAGAGTVARGTGAGGARVEPSLRAVRTEVAPRAASTLEGSTPEASTPDASTSDASQRARRWLVGGAAALLGLAGAAAWFGLR